MKDFTKNIDACLMLDFGTDRKTATAEQLHEAVSKAALALIRPEWEKVTDQKRA